jgi:Exonuclease
MWWDHLPASVVFCDVETTGLGNDDRIVSFGGIGMISRDLARRRPNLECVYLVFDPGRANRCAAKQIHGFSNSDLRRQDPFSVHAADVRRFLTAYELLVAHNAAFDIRFINREMRLAGLPALNRPVYCTMKGYRALDLGGSAALARPATTSSSLALAICTTRSRTPGSPCRSICGYTAVRFSVHSAARCRALHPTCVTPRSADTVPTEARGAVLTFPCHGTRLIFITTNGRRAA